MKLPQYWPWVDDSEGEIYDSPAWDLPGFRPHRSGGGNAVGKEVPGRERRPSFRYGIKHTLT